MSRFRLTETFLEKYKDRKPPFGFNGLGALVYARTYSRVKDDGTNEVWWETVKRVVEGTYNIQMRHIKDNKLPWNGNKAQHSAQEMFDCIYNMKFLPPGRGLWAMGSKLTEELDVFASLFNCAFVSSENLKDDLDAPFRFLMDASMLGIGVGFDTKGAGTIEVRGVSSNVTYYEIPDSREGWVDSVGLLIRSYLTGGDELEFYYGGIREAGLPIKGFGGISSGPEPLRQLHTDIRSVLHSNVGRPITVTTIVDIMNMIGRCVVAGNVRRTAEIVFGDPSDEEFISLKDYRWDNVTQGYVGAAAHRAAWGWASNNSILADIGMSYDRIGEQNSTNGEPGIEWLENARTYSRMIDPPNNVDRRVKGANPCGEQSLESYEMCCLVETFPNNCADYADYKKALKYAYLYAKTVTLCKTHWEQTNAIMLRNRRIGCSMSGVQQYVAKHSLHALKGISEQGYKAIQDYDEIYSEWLAIPRSIKTTSIKPSGTVSLLAGATPGMHWPEASDDLCYIRRMRLAVTSPLIDPLLEAGYFIEPAVESPNDTCVVEIPVQIDNYGGKLRPAHKVSMWEQLQMAAFLQRYWADNQVSCTVTFDPEREGADISSALDMFQYQLKGVSFLPRVEHGAYAQMPYESIGIEEYTKRVRNIKALDLSSVVINDTRIEVGCEGVSCEIKAASQ